MEITKIFSNNQDNERLYTVLMNDDELRIYGEFQREFARRDYEGLTSEQASKLKESRNQIANGLREIRKKQQGNLEKDWKSLTAGGWEPNVVSKGMYTKGAMGKVDYIPLNKTDNFMDFSNRVSKASSAQNLEFASKMKNIARQDALKSTPNFLQRNKGKLAIGAGLAAGTLATAAYLKNKKDKEE